MKQHYCKKQDYNFLNFDLNITSWIKSENKEHTKNEKKNKNTKKKKQQKTSQTKKKIKNENMTTLKKIKKIIKVSLKTFVNLEHNSEVSHMQ